MKSGIYKITCKENGKIYIGQSKDAKNRFRVHLSDLKRGVHTNPYFVKIYEKHGKDSFEFEVLEYCDIEKLDEREIHYISFYRSCEPEFGFNILKSPWWRDAIKARWEDPEFHKKRSQDQKKLWDDPEFRKRNEEAIRRTHEERKARGETLGCLSEEGKRKSKETCRTEEHRELRRQQALKQLEDPEYRKARAEDAKRGWKNGEREELTKFNDFQKNDEEHKRKQAEHAKKGWGDSAAREKRSQAIKEGLRRKREAANV